MMEFGNVVFQFANKRFVIFEMMIDGAACYCIQNLKTGKRVIFDHDDTVLDGVKDLNIVRNNWSIHDDGHYRRLQAYLNMLYHGKEVAERCHYTTLADTSLEKYGITDLRKANLIPRERYPETSIDIWVRPNDPNEKYIAVTCRGFTEAFAYSDPIYNKLHRKLKQITTQYGREMKRLKFRKTGLEPGINLSKFVLQECIGNLKPNYVCGHIHSGYRWINCPENLMEMLGSTNDRMSDFASQIGGGVQMRSIVYRTGTVQKILVEIEIVGCGAIYFVCDTPEQYTTLQKEIMGKLYHTKHTKLFVNDKRIETPKELYRRTKEKYNHTENKMEELWKWCEWRDRINAKYTASPDDFLPYTGNMLESLKAYKGKPIQMWYKITPIEKEADDKTA